MYTCACQNKKKNPAVIPQVAVYVFLKQGQLLAWNFAKLVSAGSSRCPPASLPSILPLLGLQVRTATPGFLYGFWGSHSDPHICKASALPWSPQPSTSLLNGSIHLTPMFSPHSTCLTIRMYSVSIC